MSAIVLLQLPDNNVHIITCDVGQGDSILVTYKNYQILTDGGNPNGMSYSCLSNYLPFWDRTIEVVVNTHPQLDHYGGLIEIFQKYKVDNFVANDLSVSSQEYKVLLNMVGSEGGRVVRPITGTSIRGGLISYDIFWPTAEFAQPSGGPLTGDPNDYSVQAIVKVGDFKTLLTGDIGENISEEVLKNFPNTSVNYIKIAHHGSKYGLTSNYLKLIEPKYAVISSGKKNTYGHPTPEIINLLNDKNIKILRTDELGDIEVVTDGVNYWLRN